MIRVASRTNLHDPEHVSESVAETVRILNAHELTPELAAALAPEVFRSLNAQHVEMEQVRITELGELHRG